jgi:DNA ligase-associated metallophosphoesterase
MLQLKPDRLELCDFSSQPIEVCGARFVADRSGALYWPAENALIVADLHLEKGSSRAAHGRLLPPWDTRTTLLRLAETADRYATAVVFALGDSLHDAGAADRMSEEDLGILRAMQRGRTWIWITGNHDPAIDRRLGGSVLSEAHNRGLSLRHAPGPGRTTHEIAGHLHPAAKLTKHGHTLRRRCFIGNGRRLVLPAFGAFTGGLNVLDEAFAPVFGPDGYSVWMLGEQGLYPVPTRQLRAD